MSHEIILLKELKTILVEFLDELIESFPKETDFVYFRIVIKDQIPEYELMKYVTNNILPFEKMVKERNENFFLGRNVLFDSFDAYDYGKGKINHFKKLWLEPSTDKEDKDAIWNWISTIISIANRYNKLKSS